MQLTAYFQVYPESDYSVTSLIWGTASAVENSFGL